MIFFTATVPIFTTSFLGSQHLLHCGLPSKVLKILRSNSTPRKNDRSSRDRKLAIFYRKNHGFHNWGTPLDGPWYTVGFGCSKSTQIWDNVTWDVMEKHVRTLAMLLFYRCEDGKMVFTEQNTGDLRESFKNLDWRYLTYVRPVSGLNFRECPCPSVLEHHLKT